MAVAGAQVLECYRVLQKTNSNVVAEVIKDGGTFDGPLMSGVWECTPGKFEISYPWGELATLLKGRITVTDSDGRAVTYEPGDSFFVAQGQRVTWEVHEPTRKCFFIHVAKAESAAAE